LVYCFYFNIFVHLSKATSLLKNFITGVFNHWGSAPAVVLARLVAEAQDWKQASRIQLSALAHRPRELRLAPYPQFSPMFVAGCID
jgi:hypothetical protein